jgi:hypothetical protein
MRNTALDAPQMFEKRTEKLMRAQNERQKKVLLNRVLREQRRQAALMQAILDELKSQG